MILIPKMNKRQESILEYIDQLGQASVSQLFALIQKQTSAISKITINRDLKKFLQDGCIVQKGAGRSVVYSISPTYAVLKPIDVKQYFAKEIDERHIHETFQFDIFSHLQHLFTDAEMTHLQTLQQMYQHKKALFPPDALKKEFERLTIDLSWKSSKIEGNTYTLLETERLIREHQESSGHTKEEAVMILNHKKAFEYIHQHRSQFQEISHRKIEQVHSMLIENLGAARNVRNVIVRITGTNYRPIDNAFQIQEALEQTCDRINAEKNPFAKALIALVMIAYIQPFVDGNKRTSRLMGNAMLLAFDCCPLSYRTVDEMEYKKALLLFYEQNNISYFKQLFIEQVDFAVRHYFGSSPTDSNY